MESEPEPSPRTRLPHVLAGLYCLAIVYASLEPFEPWLAPVPDTLFFLFGPWTGRWLRYDTLLNVLAYVPFGFFVGLLLRGASPARRIATSVIVGAVVSFAMEWLQMYLPTRVASLLDLLTNSAGALLGGVLATALARNAAMRRALYRTRARLFLPGHLGDVGLALLLFWLVAQMNPGIPLFAVTFDSDTVAPAALALGAAAPVPDTASLLVLAAGGTFQMLGVGMFAALLLRKHRNAGAIVLVMIAAALLLKGAAAILMLKPAVWQIWLKPGVLIGVAVGALLLPVAIALPRPAQVALCAIALLSSLGAPVLAPETLFARAPLALFDWHYGQLLNYSGLTRTALLIWPVLTAAWLFALAGRPAWGKPL